MTKEFEIVELTEQEMVEIDGGATDKKRKPTLPPISR